MKKAKYGDYSARQKAKLKARYKREKMLPFRARSVKELIENKELVPNMIRTFEAEKRPRLDRLDDYYMCENTDIYGRKERGEGIIGNPQRVADHRVANPFAPYITSFLTSFVAGNPITYIHDDEDVSNLITKFNTYNSIDSHTYEVFTDASIYGEGFELMYRTEDDRDRVVLLPKLDTFIIYDNTIENNELAGVTMIYSNGAEGLETTVMIYTDEYIYTSEPLEKNNGKLIIAGEPQAHPYGEQPINAYKNNRFLIGDYERVIPSIDAYDAVQSDTANYMTDLTFAMLVLQGLLNPDMSADEIVKLKQSNIMLLGSGVDKEGRATNTKAEYLYKQYDVQGVEAYKKRLENDIHKFSSTPNFSNENIGANSGVSGEALSFRLTGLNQTRVLKETFFTTGLQKRYRMLARANGFDPATIEDLTIEFHPNLSKAVLEELKAYAAAGGELSQETMLSQLSFIDDPKEEIEKMREEQVQRYKDYAAKYDAYDNVYKHHDEDPAVNFADER